MHNCRTCLCMCTFSGCIPELMLQKTGSATHCDSGTESHKRGRRDSEVLWQHALSEHFFCNMQKKIEVNCLKSAFGESGVHTGSNSCVWWLMSLDSSSSWVNIFSTLWMLRRRKWESPVVNTHTHTHPSHPVRKCPTSTQLVLSDLWPLNLTRPFCPSSCRSLDVSTWTRRFG